MANKIRGEMEFVAGEHRYTMLLTLGALAEIEDGLGLANLADIGARLKRASSADLAVVAAALLRGGGHEAMTPRGVLELSCDLATLVEAVGGAFAAAGLGAAEVPDTAAPFAGASCSRSD